MQFPRIFGGLLTLVAVASIHALASFPAAAASADSAVANHYLVAQIDEDVRPRFRFSERSQPRGDSAAPRTQATPAAAPPQTPATPAGPGSVSPNQQENQRALQQAVAQQQSGGAEPTDSPEAEGFSLGQGDVVNFSMFGQPDMATTAFVSSSGTVSLPLVGEVKIKGLTPVAAEQRIAKAYADGGFFRDPQVNITIEQYRSRQVSVLGEVNKPGRYPLETQTTVLDVLALAGGRTPTGSSYITVVRNEGGGTVRHQVDLNNLFASAGDLGAISLKAGDIVFVPEAQLFYIYGEVRKPDAYAVKPGMTVMQAISIGGGVTERGSNSRIELRRKNEQGKVERYSPELTDTIEADDVIFVKERFF